MHTCNANADYHVTSKSKRSDCNNTVDAGGWDYCSWACFDHCNMDKKGHKCWMKTSKVGTASVAGIRFKDYAEMLAARPGSTVIHTTTTPGGPCTCDFLGLNGCICEAGQAELKAERTRT